MTKREAMEYNWMMDRLRALGFTQDEAESLRRISMTLHRWSELECGTDSQCLVRGKRVAGEFVYDDNGTPFMECAGMSGRNRYYPVPDRERGALKRLQRIIGDRNARVKPEHGDTRIDPISYYVQGDPRGCSLYILRPDDVPAGADVNSYYTRGLAVA